MAKVSIIIPCYNSYHLMELCLKSLNFQTFKEFEVVFVDDCSTDNTYELLLNYLKKTSLSYKLIRNNINSGPGASRNNGIKTSTGDYIAFMDSDDWYENDYLEKMYNTAIGRDLDIIMCDYYRVYNNGRKKAMNPTIYFEPDMNKDEFLAYSFDSLCCMLSRREVFNDVLIPSTFNAEDAATIPIILANAKKIGFIRQKLYNYFHRENSLSNRKSNGDKIVSSILQAYQNIYERIYFDYEKEVEFIGIKIVLYGAILNALQCELDNLYIMQIIEEFNNNHPNWYRNSYIKTLPKSKQIFLYFVRKNMHFMLKLLVFLHSLLFRIKIA